MKSQFALGLTTAALILASLTSFCAAAHTEPTKEARVREALQKLSQEWQGLRSAIRSRQLDSEEKSKALDQFFAHLSKAYLEDGKALLEYWQDSARAKQEEQTKQVQTNNAQALESIDQFERWLASKLEEFGKDLPAEQAQVNAQAKATLDELFAKLKAKIAESVNDQSQQTESTVTKDPIQEFVVGTRDNNLIPRAELTLNLLREILRLEEENLFALLTQDENATQRINALARLQNDTYFLWKQGRGLAKLVYKIVQISKVGIELNELKEFNTSGVLAQFEELYPTVIQSADDLGVYYAKLLQSFSGLIFLVNKEAYSKIDYFQGQMPQRMPYDRVKNIVEADLGQSISQAFVTFEREPFANGSIAQVHWATVPGRKGPIRVAVKVQKDHVREELRWNARTNGILFDYLESLAEGRSQWIVKMLTSQARELNHTFVGELDFLAEARRQDLFGKLLSSSKNGIVIPKVFVKLSGPRVITSEAVCDAQRIHKAFDFICTVEAPQKETQTPIAVETKVDQTPVTSEPAQVEEETPRQPVVEASPSNLGNLFTTLFEKYGFEVGPQYLQVLRSSVPFVAVSIHLSKIQKQLKGAGRPKDDPELVAVEKTLTALVGSFLNQVVYIKEVHADYNWGNLLVDSNHNLAVLDWGQTVSTKGLVSNPVMLVLGFLKGDAELVTKRLAKVGKFADFKRDQKQIQTLVQNYLDEEGYQKQSWLQLVQGLRGTRVKADASAKADPENVEVSSPAFESRGEDSSVSATASAPVVEESPAAPEEAVSEAEPTAKKKQTQASEAAGKILIPLAKALVKYPYHRTRVKFARAFYSAQSKCSDLLTGR